MISRIKSIFFIILLLPFLLLSQHSIIKQLQHIKGVAITLKENSDFKEYYEVTVDQPIDHFNSNSEFFKQRIFVGFNNSTAPTVIETEGYEVGKVSKPEFIKDCNLISVEHRYYGRSLPDSLDWNFLTIKQAANDLHRIREIFGLLFKGKWLSTGISKGGQTALAYKMYFPNDVDATIVYVTPIKNGINDKRINDYLHFISTTYIGEKVFAFQKFAFRNKKKLLIEFEKYVKDKQYTYSTINNEKVFEYLLLEYPFAFFQNCFDNTSPPDTLTASVNQLVEAIAKVVPPRFFSDSFRSKLEPSFYMFYHELGYYEYDLTEAKQWLTSDNYPNNIFTPHNAIINFDSTYLFSLNKFISNITTEKIIFIYGESDPYTALQPTIEKNQNCLKLIVKNGCHKSRIADLDKNQQQDIFKLLSTWLQWKVGALN